MLDEVADALRRIGAGTAARKVESATLDFKRDSNKLKDTLANLADAAVCFANAAGGTIVLGVADDTAGPEAFVGTEVTADIARRGIYERTTPRLDTRVELLRTGNAALLVVHVSEGLEVYGTSTGRYSWRHGTDCLPMTADDVGRLREERRGDDWSARPCDGMQVGAVDGEALSRTRELLRTRGRDADAELARSSDEDLVTGLGLATPQGVLTNAGALLLAAAHSAAQPRIIYQHRRSASGEPDSVLRFHGPLVLAIRGLREAIEVRLNQTPVNLRAGQQVAVADFPLEAVREAFMNALVHGDHRTGRPVQIEHSPDWLSVVSPGPLVAGVTPENILRHPHRARFRSLFTACHHLGLVEQVGVGVDRMYREMLKVGRRPPRIAETRDQVSVTFRSDEPNQRVARFVDALDRDERDDLDILLVLALLRRRRSVVAPQVAAEIQRPVDDAQALLRRLASGERGMLEPTPGSAHRTQPNYRLRGAVLAELGSAVTYHRTPSDERDRKIVEHLLEYGSINNRTVQNLFDVDVHRASAVLRDLVVRGLVVRTSEQSRGHAVRYGPGPALPPAPSPRRRGRA